MGYEHSTRLAIASVMLGGGLVLGLVAFEASPGQPALRVPPAASVGRKISTQPPEQGETSGAEQGNTAKNGPARRSGVEVVPVQRTVSSFVIPTSSADDHHSSDKSPERSDRTSGVSTTTTSSSPQSSDKSKSHDAPNSHDSSRGKDG